MVDELSQAAEEGRKNAVVFNTGVPAIGAAVRDIAGRIWQAGNVYSEDRIVGLCAERVALFYALTNGAKEIIFLTVTYNSEVPPGQPCGACLEAMQRFAPNAKITLVVSGKSIGTFSVESLLPNP